MLFSTLFISLFNRLLRSLFNRLLRSLYLWGRYCLLLSNYSFLISLLLDWSYLFNLFWLNCLSLSRLLLLRLGFLISIRFLYHNRLFLSKLILRGLFLLDLSNSSIRFLGIFLGVLLSGLYLLLIIFLFSWFIFICLGTGLILSWSRFLWLGSVFGFLGGSRLLLSLLSLFSSCICTFGWFFDFWRLLLDRLLLDSGLSWILTLGWLLWGFLSLLWFSGLFSRWLHRLLSRGLLLLRLFFGHWLSWLLDFGFGYWIYSILSFLGGGTFTLSFLPPTTTLWLSLSLPSKNKFIQLSSSNYLLVGHPWSKIWNWLLRPWCWIGCRHQCGLLIFLEAFWLGLVLWQLFEVAPAFHSLSIILVICLVW